MEYYCIGLGLKLVDGFSFIGMKGFWISFSVRLGLRVCYCYFYCEDFGLSVGFVFYYLCYVISLF